MGGARAADAPAQGRPALRPGRAARASRRGPLARAARRRAGRRDAAAAVHHRAARRPRALPDGLRARAGLGGGADRRACTSRRSCSRSSTPRASRSTSGSTRSARSTRSTLEEHVIHGERYEVAPAEWERIRAAERVLAVGTTTVRTLETLARGAPLAGPHRALHHAGLRVPARRRAADELPPAALDAARARDGVRGRRGDAPPLRARDRGAVPLLLVRRCDADPVKTRSANEWRDFWRDARRARARSAARRVRAVRDPRGDAPRQPRAARPRSSPSLHESASTSSASPRNRRETRRSPTRARLVRRRMTESLHAHRHRRRRARRRPAHRARRRPRRPAFMPVGTKGTVKGVDPEELRALGAQIVLGNTYHLHFRPGEELIAELGGLHAFMALGRADPDRLRRLPGLLAARHAARVRRRRRDVPLRLRRPRGTLHARARSEDPGASRLGHRDVPRHLPAGRRVARGARGGRAPDDALGAEATRPAARARPAPLRDHAGRSRHRVARALERGARAARLRRVCDRRAQRRRGARADVRGDRSTRPRSCPPTSRATSWGSAIPRA